MAPPLNNFICRAMSGYAMIFFFFLRKKDLGNSSILSLLPLLPSSPPPIPRQVLPDDADDDDVRGLPRHADRQLRQRERLPAGEHRTPVQHTVRMMGYDGTPQRRGIQDEKRKIKEMSTNLGWFQVLKQEKLKIFLK